jgi:hypothetical protein
MRKRPGSRTLAEICGFEDVGTPKGQQSADGWDVEGSDLVEKNEKT